MNTANLLLKERHAFIQERLLADGRVLALDLAQQLNVSEDTIRRDLRDLAAAGLCTRVYGGALPPPPAAGPLAERRSQAPERKARLAQAAISLVVADSVLFIDAGSTNLAIAAALPQLPLTVVTNAAAVALALQDRPAIELIMIGGRVNRRSGANLGAAALRDAERMRPDIFFLGGCGLDAAAGITCFNYEEAEFKRSLASASKSVLVAAISEKFGTAAPYAVLPAAHLTYLALESETDSHQADGFARQGVQLLYANAD
ncbi:MAG: Transcriptional regulator of sugar metabolism [Collimonas fungivorans]|uniref:DeoR/GlpR family DNA-binding transcription regulator n=1 Tax=Collimonas fungivorans TaxID=158899 RepID=UPI0026EB0D51|nr:DeoR/GlpR family DNA-binding transcription regulator [Collimonas fungivorans]MDB5765285.1 Transcriptional regulator of sugar metabolism [Collimonas fungivorans]